MTRQRTRRVIDVVAPTPFEEARDELFQQIMQCGVIGADPAHQEDWFRETMAYLADRYPELRSPALTELGHSVSDTFSPHGPPSAPDPASPPLTPPSAATKVERAVSGRRAVRAARLGATFAEAFALGFAAAAWTLVCGDGRCPPVDLLEVYQPRQTIQAIRRGRELRFGASAPSTGPSSRSVTSRGPCATRS